MHPSLGGGVPCASVELWLGFAYRFDRGFWLRVVCVYDTYMFPLLESRLGISSRFQQFYK